MGNDYYVVHPILGTLKFETNEYLKPNDNENLAIDRTVQNMLKVRTERENARSRSESLSAQGLAAEVAGGVAGGLAAARTLNPTAAFGAQQATRSLIQRGIVNLGVGAASGVGAAGARLTFDTANEAYEAMGLAPVSAPSGGVPGSLERAAQAGKEQIVGTAAFGAGGTAAKAGARKFLGISNYAKVAKDIKDAADMGISLALEDVTENVILSNYRNSIGRMPLVSTTFTKTTPIQRLKGQVNPAEQRQRELEASVDALGIHPFAPVVSISRASNGLLDAAVRRKTRISQAVDRAWERARTQATADGGFYTPTNTKNTAKTILDEIKTNTPTFAKETMDPTTGVPILQSTPIATRKRDTSLDRWIRTISTLEDYQTIPQYTDLVREINFRVRHANPTQARDLMRLKESLEHDLAAAVIEPETRLLMQKANRVSAWEKQLYSRGTVAREFEKVDRDIFEAGPLSRPGEPYKARTPGSRTVDDALEITFIDNDLGAMKELRLVVGRPAFKNATNAHIDNVWAKHTINDQGKVWFDTAKIRAELGLGAKADPRQRTGLMYAVGESKLPYDVPKLEKLLDMIELAQKRGAAPDTATYLTRRFLLQGGKVAGAGGAVAGLASFVGGLSGSALGGMAGAGAGAGFLSLLAFVGTARSFAKLVSRPSRLDRIMVALDPQANHQVRAAAESAVSREIFHELIATQRRAMGDNTQPTSAEVEGVYREYLNQVGQQSQ